MDFQQLYSMGNEALKQKDFESAKKYFEEAINLKPDDIYATNKLAIVLKELGDFDRAKSLLGESSTRDNEDL